MTVQKHAGAGLWAVCDESGKALAVFKTKEEAIAFSFAPNGEGGLHTTGPIEEPRKKMSRLFSVDAWKFSMSPGVGKWDRFTSWGTKIKDEQESVFNEENLGQMVDNFASRKNDIAMCYDHQSAYVENNGQPAPALAFYCALALVVDGKVTKFASHSNDVDPPDASGLDNGVYGYRSKVTPLGEKLLPNYQYLSPMFTDQGADEQGNPIGYDLMDVAATNTPFQDGVALTFHKGATMAKAAKTTMSLGPGDRVKYVMNGNRMDEGVIESISGGYVHVKWEKGAVEPVCPVAMLGDRIQKMNAIKATSNVTTMAERNRDLIEAVANLLRSAGWDAQAQQFLDDPGARSRIAGDFMRKYPSSSARIGRAGAIAGFAKNQTSKSTRGASRRSYTKGAQMDEVMKKLGILADGATDEEKMAALSKYADEVAAAKMADEGDKEEEEKKLSDDVAMEDDKEEETKMADGEQKEPGDDAEEMKKMAKSLGLPSNATLKQIHMAMGIKTAPKSEIALMRKQVAQLQADANNRIEAEKKDRAAKLVDGAIKMGKLKKDKRASLMSYALTDFAAAEQFVADLEITEPTELVARQTFTKGGNPVAQKRTSSEPVTEARVAGGTVPVRGSEFAAKARTYAKTNKVSLAEAQQEVLRANPEFATDLF